MFPSNPRFSLSTLTLLVVVSATFSATSCGDDTTETEAPPTTTDTQTSNTQDTDPCRAHIAADDFQIDTRLGPQGDPANWPPPSELPPNAVVASTFLRLGAEQGSQERFDSLMGPIIGELMAPAPGLLGLSFAGSQACGVSRTLSLWENEEAMMNFVLGDAHSEAMGAVGDVSRGGSITSQWPLRSFEIVSWEAVLTRFQDHEGPVY